MGRPSRTDKPRLLVIPHQPHRGVRVRFVEMARYLAQTGAYEVFMLTWDQASPSPSGLLGKLAVRSREAVRTFREPEQIEFSEGMQWVRLPHLLAPYPLCQRFNQAQIDRFIRQHDIDVILGANAYHFPVPPSASKRPLFLYDVVDDHLTPESGPAWRRTRAFTLGELRKADRILTISHALRDVLRQEGFPEVIRVPNGVNLGAFRSPNPQAVAGLRERFGLAGRFSIGYIGNHGWWAGMDFLLETFRRLRERLPESRLLIVGPGEDLARFEAEWASDSVIFTGPVPPAEIIPYFQAVDIGVLPFDLCPFTHNALPIKVLEYGAARKRVLASPLRELETLDFPHVQRLPLDTETWVAELAREAQDRTAWEPAWDATLEEYDWPKILAAVDATIRADLGSASRKPVPAP